MFFQPQPRPIPQPRTDGILLANTGSPDAPTPPAVRRYLARFLGDRRVIDLPRWFWLPLLHGVILNTRPRRSARLYRRIWTPDGSPLVVGTQRLAAALDRALNTAPGGEDRPVRVAAGMRYGEPSIATTLQALEAHNLRKLVILPLFPQYSATTTAAIFDAVTTELRAWRRLPTLEFIHGYHDHPAYLRALATSIQTHRRPGAHLLFSFHGLPRSYVEAGDPYQAHCVQTAHLLAEELVLKPGDWSLSFQSRFGRGEWLRPYTGELLAEYGRRGMPALDVACPGFAVDCLETLDEIAHEGRARFQSAGGGEFTCIPALNDSPEHVQALARILRPHLE